MKKKNRVIIGIIIVVLIFGALLKMNKRIVDKNAVITKSETSGNILYGEDSKEGFLTKIKNKIKNFKDARAQAKEDDNEIKISVVGDILFDGNIRDNINEEGYDYPWLHVKEYFENEDISIGNLETSVTRGGTPWANKQFNFRSDPKKISSMKRVGIDVISLANNHTLDYGYDSLEDTIEHLKSVEAGENIEEATKP